MCFVWFHVANAWTIAVVSASSYNPFLTLCTRLECEISSRQWLLPLVELSVNEVLRLIGWRLRREGDELRYEIFWHALGQLVSDSQRLTSARRTDTQHLQIWYTLPLYLTLRPTSSIETEQEVKKLSGKVTSHVVPLSRLNDPLRCCNAVTEWSRLLRTPQQRLSIIFHGPDNPKITSFSWGISTPSNYMVPLAYSSQPANGIWIGSAVLQGASV